MLLFGMSNELWCIEVLNVIKIIQTIWAIYFQFFKGHVKIWIGCGAVYKNMLMDYLLL